MPIRSEVDESAQLLMFEIVGDWTTEEMERVTLEGVRAIAGREGYDALCDLTRTGRVSTPAEIRRLVQILTEEGSALRGRRAAMVVGNPTSYGMMRMLSAHTEPIGIEVKIFTQLGEAMKFLRPA
ncbi:MAG TPA: STAS/SEC14 domain-containing protein [Gemmatimonadaceae bacterium]|nr:STAS/SEC14 domain-containing protein [Gemmatimonadaceae bacterium]